MSHYDASYFNWQKNIGAFGAMVNLFMYKDFIAKDDKVIDFGAGGGFLLANLACKEKIGVEINETARETAKKNGIATYPNADDIEDEWADVVISNHALEHVDCPLSELKKLYKKLKKGGKIVLVVPNEKTNPYKSNDINFHLYTWSAMNLGNLFKHAGFDVVEVKEIKHKWPPKYLLIRKLLGPVGFNLLARIYARLSPGISQVRIVALKPA